MEKRKMIKFMGKFVNYCCCWSTGKHYENTSQLQLASCAKLLNINSHTEQHDNVVGLLPFVVFLPLPKFPDIYTPYDENRNNIHTEWRNFYRIENEKCDVRVIINQDFFFAQFNRWPV